MWALDGDALAGPVFFGRVWVDQNAKVSSLTQYLGKKSNGFSNEFI